MNRAGGLLAESDDMIQYGRVQRPFENASRFMRAAPQHACPAAFEAGQHDPQIIVGSQFHETFQTEANFRDVSDVALEPGLAGSPDPNGDQRRTAVCQTMIAVIRVCLNFGAHDPMPI